MREYRVKFQRVLPSGIVSTITLSAKASEPDEAVAKLEGELGPTWQVMSVVNN